MTFICPADVSGRVHEEAHCCYLWTNDEWQPSNRQIDREAICRIHLIHAQANESQHCAPNLETNPIIHRNAARRGELSMVSF